MTEELFWSTLDASPIGTVMQHSSGRKIRKTSNSSYEIELTPEQAERLREHIRSGKPTKYPCKKCSTLMHEMDVMPDGTRTLRCSGCNWWVLTRESDPE